MVESSTNGGARHGSKRAKYTDRACLQCKRRKVKCSGAEKDACQQCRSRGVPCRSSADPGAQDGDAPLDNYAAQAVDAPGKRCAFAPAPAHLSSRSAEGHPVHSSTDPRVDGLCERVKSLEDVLTQLSGSMKAAPNALSPYRFMGTAGSRTQIGDEGDDDGDDTHQIEPEGAVADNVSLSSQVAAMRALLSRPPSTGPNRRVSGTKAGLLVELPDPASLQRLFDVYFRDFDGYFPFLNRRELEARVHSTIRRLGYSTHSVVLIVNNEELSTIALLCIMLALAECVDTGEGACDGNRKPGWDMYLLCHRAIDRLSRVRPLELDVVRAQCLAAAYLMHGEALQEDSQAVTAVWQLATSIRLSDQKVWPKDGPELSLQRRQLWWTIYFLDRQVSRKSGIAYHIRDLEFDVEDFTDNETDADNSQTSGTDRPSVIAKSYMQGLVKLARLWGNVWDNFFAVGATKKGDWMDVEIMDVRILNTRRQLPEYLTWDSNGLANYISTGEDDSHILRRPQLYTRLELLRMLIRQNPVRRAPFVPETARLCSQLAQQIIGAHDVFITRCRRARATGYFTTSSIVECIYHLVQVLHNSQDEKEHAACVSAFRLAHSILVRLSSFNKVANKALRALNGCVRRWGNDHNETRAGGFGGCDGMGKSNDIFTPSQIGSIGVIPNQFGADGLDVNLGDWSDLSMGSLFGNGFDPRSGTLFE